MENIPVSEGTRKMMETVQNELFPILNELKQLLIDIQNLRVVFPLYLKDLNKINNKYGEIAKRFFIVVQKLETPDILFEGLPKNNQDIASYFQFQGAISKHISEGSKYIEIIDRTLDRKRQTIFNSWTLFLAILAIAVSIIFTMHEKGSDKTKSCLRGHYIQQHIR